MDKQPISSRTHSLIWVCAFLLFLHFTMISLFTVPGLPAPQVVHAAARSYTFPMFFQSWKLFAPTMRTFQNELDYRYAKEGEWSDWKSPGVEGTDDVSRLTYYTGKVAMKLHSSCNDKENGIYYIDSIPQTDAVEKSTDFIRASYLCYKHSKHFYKITPDSVQLRLKYRFIPDYKTREVQDDLEFTFSPYDTREG